MTISQYHSTDCSLLSAMLVLSCVFNSPKVVAVAASTWAVSTAFSGILIVVSVYFYRNCSSECVIR